MIIRIWRFQMTHKNILILSYFFYKFIFIHYCQISVRRSYQYVGYICSPLLSFFFQQNTMSSIDTNHCINISHCILHVIFQKLHTRYKTFSMLDIHILNYFEQNGHILWMLYPCFQCVLCLVSPFRKKKEKRKVR